MVKVLSPASIAIALIALSMAPGAVASESGRTAGLPALPTPSTGTLASPTTVSSSSITITALWAYTDGIRSKTLYVGHHTDLYMAYRIVGAPSGSRTATISVVFRGATILQVRRPLSSKPEGSISVHVTQPFQPGVLQLTGMVQTGKDTQLTHRRIIVLDPRGFLLGRSFTNSGVAKLRTSRIESNQKAEREHYVIHGGRTYSQLGRQAGTFEALTLTWPYVERSQIVVEATLVSTFGSAQRALTAYQDEVQQNQSRQGCTNGCTFRAQAARAAKQFGRIRAAFNLYSNAGVSVRVTLFARGSMLIENWTYYSGLLSSPMSKELSNATTARLEKLDTVATVQQAK